MAIIIFALTFSIPTFSGTLYKWTDENGVMHMSTQPPPEDVEHKKSKYKNPPARKQSRARNLNYEKKSEENNRQKRQLNEEKLREIEQRKIDRELKKIRDKQQRELETAKRDYEFYEGERETYRKYYHESRSTVARNHWYKKLKEADEAKSKYFRLKAEYGE